MPSKSKSSEIKKRPPRLYYDKATDRYYIYMGKKKVWYKKGEDPKKIRKQLLTKVRTDNVGTRRNKAVNVKVNVVNNIKGPSRRNGQSKAKVTTGFSNMQYMEQQRVLELARLRSALSSATESQRKAELAANQVVVKPNVTPAINVAAQDVDVLKATKAAIMAKAKGDVEAEQKEIAKLRRKISNQKKKTPPNEVLIAQYEQSIKDKEQMQKRIMAEAKENEQEQERLILNELKRLKDIAANRPKQPEVVEDSDEEREEAKEEKKVTLPKVIDLTNKGTVLVGKETDDSKDSDDELEVVDKSQKGFFGTVVDAGKNIFAPKKPKKGSGKETGANGEPLPKQVARVGLYSDQIARMMSRYVDDGFLGVVAADEVDELGPKSSRYDKFGFIMNKDTSDKPGSHWTACFVDTIDDKSVEYYDSFGEEPDEIFLREVKGLIQAHKLPIYLKMKINKVKRQAENSNLCGFHAMKFLMDRFEGKPFVEASGWSEVRKGEADAKKLMDNMSGKGTKFGYI